MNDKTKLSPDEQRFYDRLAKTCSRPLSKIPQGVQNTCIVVKKQIEQDAAQKKAEAESIARAKLGGARLEAVLFVVGRVSARQAEATMILGALIQASSEYDQILAARAAKPFIGELLLGVGLSFLPELKVLGRIAGRCVPNVASARVIRALSKAQGSSPSLASWETLAENLLAKSKRVEGRVIWFAQALDSASNDAIGAARSPLMSSSDADADTQARLAGFAAKNKIMGDLINAISRSLWIMTKMQNLLFNFILWSDDTDVAAQVKTAFTVADLLDDVPYSSSTFVLFGDLILYDMLRAYVKDYFVVDVVKSNYGYTSQSVDDLPQSYSDDVHGLDDAQRAMIYDRFGSGKLKWHDPSRPPVNDYKDFVKKWGASLGSKFVRPMGVA